MQILILIIVAGIFVISPNLLYLLGISYATSTGSMMEKVHPTFYLAVLALVVASVFKIPRGPGDKGMRRTAFWMAGVAIAALVIFAVTTEDSGGGELSIILITYLMPALTIFVLGYVDDKTMSQLPKLLSLLFLANSALGIVESQTGWRLLPFVAGDLLLDFDQRSTAIFGHPLTNALLTGAWALILLMRGFRGGFKFPMLALIGLHIVAMLAFGGRAALVMVGVTFGIYAAYRTLAMLSNGQGGREVMRGVIILAVLCVIIPIVLASGLADAIIERFLDSRGSDETRFAALDMLSMISPSEWWTGTSLSLRTALRGDLSSQYGIELSWIAMLLIYGLPVAIALLGASFWLLFAVGGRGPQPKILIFYYAVVTFSSASISGKTLLISQMICLLLCLRSYQGAVIKSVAQSNVGDLPGTYNEPDDPRTLA